MIDHALKEQMRRQIVDGYIQAGAPRDLAHEIADLTLYPFEQAAEALLRVANSASCYGVFSAVLINATQIAGTLFTDKAEGLVQTAVDVGLANGAGFHIGDVLQ